MGHPSLPDPRPPSGEREILKHPQAARFRRPPCRLWVIRSGMNSRTGEGSQPISGGKTGTLERSPLGPRAEPSRVESSRAANVNAPAPPRGTLPPPDGRGLKGALRIVGQLVVRGPSP